MRMENRKIRIRLFSYFRKDQRNSKLIMMKRKLLLLGDGHQKSLIFIESAFASSLQSFRRQFNEINGLSVSFSMHDVLPFVLHALLKHCTWMVWLCPCAHTVSIIS